VWSICIGLLFPTLDVGFDWLGNNLLLVSQVIRYTYGATQIKTVYGNAINNTLNISIRLVVSEDNLVVIVILLCLVHQWSDRISFPFHIRIHKVVLLRQIIALLYTYILLNQTDIVWKKDIIIVKWGHTWDQLQIWWHVDLQKIRLIFIFTFVLNLWQNKFRTHSRLLFFGNEIMSYSVSCTQYVATSIHSVYKMAKATLRAQMDTLRCNCWFNTQFGIAIRKIASAKSTPVFN
jgi:hypothetical protein